MIPELGTYALILSLCLALVQGTFPLAGATRGYIAWMNLARAASRGQFGFLLIALICLAWSFVQNDFSVEYVAQNSNTALPLYYRLSAVWGGHEGSLLLWAFMLGSWTLTVSLASNGLPAEFQARVLGVMGLVSAGFLMFMLFTSNPFGRLDPADLPPGFEGRDLNPLLQDPGLIIHPPMLYLGYVGFAVAFAFAIAALLGGRLDAAWARWSRPWTLTAWVCLTLGIALGSFWAYYELGWGGWWFWDPVENASFMPWLVGTALLHSLAVTEKRGEFRAWTLLLAIFAFSLSLLGTFLVRSGVLTSVHAFASDPRRGVFILVFLATVVGSSLLLYALRGPKMRRRSGGFSLVSREAALLANNVLLVAATATILLGTLYPLMMDALDLGKISVGPPYFSSVFVPLMTPLVFLMGVGSLLRWRRTALRDLVIRLRWTAAVALFVAVGGPLLAGQWTPMVSLGLWLALWVIAATIETLEVRVRTVGRWDIAEGLRAVPLGVWGMSLAHCGVGIFIVGVTLSGGYSEEREVRLAPGQSITMASYEFRFDGVSQIPGPNYTAHQGTVTVTNPHGRAWVLYPQKRIYHVQTMPMTEAAIDYGLLRHLYVALGESVSGGAWSLRLYVKPFVGWIWLGTLMMALGGGLAAADRRYRLSLRHNPKDEKHEIQRVDPTP
ncbi:holocytochrome c synthase CcmF component [Gammaproteobacteria bacterium]